MFVGKLEITDIRLLYLMLEGNFNRSFTMLIRYHTTLLIQQLNIHCHFSSPVQGTERTIALSTGSSAASVLAKC